MAAQGNASSRTTPPAEDTALNGSLLQDRWTFVDDSSIVDSSLTASTAVPMPTLPDVGTPKITRQPSPAFVAPFTLASPRHREGEDPAEQQKGSQISAIVNLLATAMGAGLLSLPRAFAHCGVVTGVVMLLLCGWSADLSLQFLVMCARASGRYSFEGNAQHYLGVWGRRAINNLLLVLLFFAATAMIVIIFELLPDFLEEVVGQQSSLFVQPLFVTIVGLLLMFPVCVKEDITILRYTSALALCNLCYYFTCLHIRFWGRPGASRIDNSVKLYTTDVLSAFQGFSIMVAAYLCHFNIFKIDFELAKPSKPYVWRVIHISIPGVATMIYICGGLLGYLMFGEGVSSNMLEQFPNDRLMMVARLALSLTNLFKLPLIIQPLRQSIEEALPESVPKSKIVETLAILGCCFTLAMLLSSLSRVLGILGCTAGMAIAFILPGLMRVQYGKHIEDGRLILHASSRQLSARETRALNSRVSVCSAWALAIIGSLFSIGALAGIIVNWNK